MSEAPAGFLEALHDFMDDTSAWPSFLDDREACMARAREFIDARDALFARFGVTIEDVRKGFTP